MFSYSLVSLSISSLDFSPPPNPPPPEFIGAAASRIYHGAPARQLDRFDRSQPRK